MRNIVVATDGSGDASRAVDVAAELTKAFGGKLFIVTVAGDLSGQEMRELALMREKNFEFRASRAGSQADDGTWSRSMKADPKGILNMVKIDAACCWALWSVQFADNRERRRRRGHYGAELL